VVVGRCGEGEADFTCPTTGINITHVVGWVEQREAQRNAALQPIVGQKKLAQPTGSDQPVWNQHHQIVGWVERSEAQLNVRRQLIVGQKTCPIYGR